MQEEEQLLDTDGDWSTNKRSMDSPSLLEESVELGFFRVWLLISQLLGVLCIILVGSWCGQHLGGFAWQDDPKLEFNYHPLFMVIGFVFCFGNSLLVYRAFRNRSKSSLKLFHLALHSLAIIFIVVGLKAVFDSHNLASPPIPNLYSLHSWIGLTAVILFFMQYVFGIVAFLFPGLRKVWRSKYLPLHVFFGLVIFGMGIAAAFMGITEKLMFATLGKYKDLPPVAILGNILGFCLLAFGVLVIYMVTTPDFRRRMLPEEQQLQLEQQHPASN